MIILHVLIFTTLLHLVTSLPPLQRADSPLKPLSLMPTHLNLSVPDHGPFVPEATVCYDRRYAWHDRPPDYQGCSTVIEHKIAIGEHPELYHAFARRPDPRKQSRVPKAWVDPEQTCGIHIDVPGAVVELATLVEIQAAARVIAIKCVLGEERLGGFTFIGMSGQLLVSIQRNK
ncbi:MAG: hypothetical protein Q9204_006829 [Flavoplaca sp. TL-2023a]